MKHYILVFYLLICSNTAFAQITEIIQADLSVEALRDTMLHFHRNADYEIAEQIARFKLQKVARELGQEDEAYSKSLNNVGVMLTAQNRYPEAQIYLDSALMTTQRYFGTNTRLYAMQHNDLARLYDKQGKFDEALASFLIAIEILERTDNQKDPQYRRILNSLAVLYNDIGQHDKAINTYEKSLEATALTDGKNHYRYAIRLMNISSVYNDIEQHEKAAELTTQALTILSATLGEEHPYYGIGLNNLAQQYQEFNRLEEADSLYQKSLKIMRTSFGETHTNYASILLNATRLQLQKMQWDSAEVYLKDVLQIFEKELSTAHPNIRTTYQRLGELYIGKQEIDKAAEAYLSMNASLVQQVREQFDQLSEKEQLALFDKLQRNLAILQSFSWDHPEQQAVVNACYNNMLLIKGLLLNNKKRLLDALTQIEDAALQSQIQEWEKLALRLAREYSLPLKDQSPSLDSLKEKANQLESALSRASSAFKTTQQEVNWLDLQQQLQTGEAAIEFAHFTYQQAGSTQNESYYVAYFLDKENAPVQINLFKEKQLSPFVKQGRRNLPTHIERVYSPQLGGTLENELYNLVWKPIEAYVENIQRIHFATAGKLHQVCIPALPIDAKNTLADRYDFHYHSSTRALLQTSSPTPTNTSSNALLFGGIFYDVDSLNLVQSLNEMPINAQRGSSPWRFLHGTVRELATIKNLLKGAGTAVEVKQFYNATEDYFKAIGQGNTPSIIHIATHGYFFERDSSDVIFRNSSNAMIRSGLIMAGGNRIWSGQRAFKGFEDGVLTAFEIAQLDLSDTELVVLSACETGLGDVVGTEEVFGLQRAFQLAGVENIIMSFWQVPDFQTQELMTLFYQNWLDTRSYHKAFYAAQQEMRQRYSNPFYWAGFVLVE